MVKKLNTEGVINELKGQSVFFKHAKPQKLSKPTPPSSKTKPKPKGKNLEKPGKTKGDTTVPRYHDTTVPRHRDTIQTVVDAVRQFGKEAATHRFTVEEKKAISDIIYAYKGQSVRTTENEVARISINYIIQDYRENGENSILEKTLKSLKG